MNNETLEEEKTEINSDEAADKINDPRLREIFDSLDELIISDKLAQDIRTLIHKATWDIKISKSEERAHYVLEPVQTLYEMRDRYCKELAVENIPDLNEIIIKISKYLYEFATEITTAEATNKKN